MENITYKNEDIKRNFFDYLKNSKTGYSDKSIECCEKAIWLWQEFSHEADFAKFTKIKAKDFKKWLKDKKKRNSKKNVGLSYCHTNLRLLRVFFGWLASQPGYKKINQTAIDYLNLSKKEAREATQPTRRQCPTLEDVKRVIESIEVKNEIDRRDKALISLMFLTGIRITAISTLPMASLDRKNLVINQDPRLGVLTKNSKRITTTIIPFSYKEPLDYFLEWFDYLKNKKGFQPIDPIFPATKKENGKDNLGYYNTGKVEAVFWKSQTSIRKIFDKRFKKAGVNYYHPHSFRHLLVQEISKIPLTEEQKKAFSQNLGHSNVSTTFGSYGYGEIADDRQIEIIRNINFDDKLTEVKYNLSKKEIWELADELKKYPKNE